MSLKTPIKTLTIKAKIEEIDFDEVEHEIKAATSAEQIIFEPTRGKKPEKDIEIENNNLSNLMQGIKQVNFLFFVFGIEF